MGVPGLFSFLGRRFPQICRPTEKRREGQPRSDTDTTDNLYIDMNHIIHSCTHAYVAKDRPEGLSRQQQLGGMAAYLEALLDLLQPRRVVLIAVDGVAPRAKMNQQRTRRFLSAHISDITDGIEREVKREMLSEAGGAIVIPDVTRFDSNIITPGTDFMTEVAQWLRQWAADKAANDPRFKHTTFIISDASEPGEGEHKVMKFVRHLKAQPGYDPATRHVVYGQDADLLLLALLCHEPYFKVMREDMQGGEAASSKAAREAQMAQEQQQLLHFLAGNDFLPNVPSIDIYDKPCGLDLLFTAYKALLLGMGGHLTSGGTINRSRLVQLLVFLARDEEAAYKRRADYRRRRAQQRHNEQAAAQQQLSSLLDGGLSMGELPPGIDLDALLSGLDPSVAEALGLSGMSDKPPPPDLTTLSPGQLCEELAGRVAARVKERLMGGDPWAQDPLCMDLPGYRQRYYEARFPELLEEFEGDVDRVAARVAWDYMQGISWVLRYYTCGPAALQWQQHGQPAAAAAAAGQQQLRGSNSSSSKKSKSASSSSSEAAAGIEGASWTWCYPHHYAPLMQDLAKAKLWQKQQRGSRQQDFSAPPVQLSRSLSNPHSCTLQQWAPPGGPVRPLLQLMCVLPANNVEPLVDLTGKRWLHTGVHSCCLLPGAEPPHLTVTPAVWRHVAAGFASSISCAEKVLGIRSSSNSEAAAEGGGSRGGFSGRGGGGGFSGRGRSGRAGGAGERGRGGRDVRYGGKRGSSSSSYGAGAGSSRTGDAGGAAGYAAYGASQQQQQQQQPYLDPAYYYADDSYYAAGGSSSGGRGRGSRGGGYGSRTRGSRY
ncbi:hypothetical protein OEZ86_013561 [Tetradesmus obliquus]|nr:hypothetical protein OEZ86_013561 [Tetradesmus obliquus]